MFFVTSKKFIFLAIALLSLGDVKAYDFEVNGLYYDLLSTSEATVSFVGAKDTKDLKIPTYIVVSNRKLSVIQVDCINLKVETLTIPESVTEIKQCQGDFRRVSIPSTIDKIAEYAFYGCKNLEELVLPTTTKRIGHGAFENCTSLKKVKFPYGLTSIGGRAFDGAKLRNITIPGSVTSIGGDDRGIYQYETSFNDCSNLDTLIFEDGNQKLLFADGYQIVGRNSEEKFGEFYKCKDVLEYIYFGRNMYLRTYSYHGRGPEFHKAKVVVFGDNCMQAEIEQTQGSNRKKTYSMSSDELKSVTFGKKMTEIPSYIESINLMKVYVRADTPQEAQGFSSNTYIKGTLYVPRGTMNKYKNASVWKEFWNIKEYDITTDIKTPSVYNSSHSNIYNINGYKCNSEQKGINIINGKKYFVK